MNKNEKKQIIEERVYFDSGYRGTIIHHGESTNSRHGCWIKKLRDYIFNQNLKADSRM